LVRRTIHRSPAGGPAHEVGDLGDVLVLLDGGVLAGCGLPRRCGQLPDRVLVGFGDRPAGGEQHGAAPRRQRQQVADEFVAGAGTVDADQQPGPEAGGDLPDRRRQDREVVGEGVRPGVARPQQHSQRLGGIGKPGPCGPQHDRHRHGHQRHTAVDQRELPGTRQRRAERGGQPGPVGQLAQ
jgi:hypothetical protein